MSKHNRLPHNRPETLSGWPAGWEKWGSMYRPAEPQRLSWAARLIAWLVGHTR